jgi:hypothetical protein
LNENISAQSEAYKSETHADEAQQDSRSELQEMFENTPLPTEDLLFNMGMYTRGSLLVKFLVMNDLYNRIKDIPGAIMEFGVWYGQNIILLENLRAIYEPFNKQRRIIGFDTFSGYENFSDQDKYSKAFESGSYSTPKEYKTYLEELIKVHEGSNILGHVSGGHELVEGDVEKTVPQYFVDHPETIVAMAYFDMGNYKPTKAALEAVKPHLVPGSVLLFDELTWSEAPGEAIAFKEVLKDVDFTIEKSKFYPSKAIVTIK